MGTYVLVHGAWHTGKELEPVANLMNAAGHNAYTPTVKGNRPGDPKTIGLEEAIGSIVAYLDENNFKEVVLVGHSYGGMISLASPIEFPKGFAGSYIGMRSFPTTAKA